MGWNPKVDTLGIASGEVTFTGKGRPMQPEWQPIETAPKDRTALLLFLKSDEYRIGSWQSENSYWMDDSDYTALVRAFEPTHWMPLPSPPPQT